MKKVRTKVTGKVAVKQKVAVSIMMMSAFVLALSFAGVAISKSNTNQLVRPIKISPIRPTPLILEGIQGAAVNVRIFDYLSSPRASFYNAGNDLGSLELASQYFHGPTDSWGVDPLEERPFEVNLNHSSGGIQSFPARIINVADSNSDLRYNLCVPATEVPGMDAYPNDGFSYYYDVSGTPYYDMALTRPAMAKNCAKLLAKSFSIEAIEDADVNLRVALEGYGSISAGFIDDFSQYSDTLGRLDLSNNSYSLHTVDSDNVLSPLAIEFSHSDEGSKTLPARVIAVSEIGGQKKALCVPTTQVPGMDATPNDNVTYFYDNNGTPYYDSLLMQRAIPGDCNEILAKSFSIEAIEDADVNLRVALEGYGSISAGFIDDFSQYSDTLGRLDLSNNSYSLHTVDSDNVLSPLAIEFSHSGEGSKTLPARVMFMEDSQQISPYHFLCIPTTQVPGMDAYPNDTATYFYDNNGTPYYDSLLMQKAIPKDCNEILANSLTINNIETASINNVIVDPEFALAGFARNGHSLGMLDLSNNEFNSSYNEDPPFIMNDPMILILGHSTDGTEPFPYSRISLGGEQNYTLCVPPTQVPGMDSSPIDYAIYFYDRSGNPYSDSLLLNRVTCPPLKPIDEIPYEAFDGDAIR